MKWNHVPCSNELLGEREGHCSACVKILQSCCSDFVFVVGGFREGEIPPEVIAAPLDHNLLRWSVVACDEEVFAKDGASLTTLPPEAVKSDSSNCCNDDHRDGGKMILFGGMNGSAQKTNDAFIIDVGWNSDEATVAVTWRQISLLGDVPSPRFRHAVANSSTSLFIFGGATDTSDQSNELFEVHFASLVSRRVDGIDTAAISSLHPRFLSCLVYIPKHQVLVLYGGAYFEQGVQKSCSDVRVIDAVSWSAAPVTFITQNPQSVPQCNGHVGVCLAVGDDEQAVFSGGKDFDEGSDDLVIVSSSSSPSGGRSFEVRIQAAAPNDDKDGCVPHWRYTASTVQLSSALWVFAGQCRHPYEKAVYVLLSSS